MADYQTLLDAVGLVIGGTAPDATGRPHYFSGAEVGDGTEMGHGTPNPLLGCWAVAPSTIEQTPMALVMPDSFAISGPEKADVFVAGEEWNVDVLRLQFFLALVDHRTDWVLMNPYRDLIPALFRAHMMLNATPNVITTMIRSGKAAVLDYNATQYVGWTAVPPVHAAIQPFYTPCWALADSFNSSLNPASAQHTTASPHPRWLSRVGQPVPPLSRLLPPRGESASSGSCFRANPSL